MILLCFIVSDYDYDYEEPKQEAKSGKCGNRKGGKCGQVKKDSKEKKGNKNFSQNNTGLDSPK